MKLTKEQLIKIQGGGWLTGTILNAVIKGVGTIFELGKSLGSAIRRISAGSVCTVSR